MSPTQKAHKGRVYLTLVVAASHFALMVLGVVDRLTFYTPSRNSILLQTLDNPLWAILHGLCALAIVFALRHRRYIVPALGSATGVMGAWSFLSLLWGLTTLIPISLAAPVLGFGIAALAYLLTTAWASVPRSDTTRS